MDFFSLLTTWFWYLMAFGAGMLVAWLVARQFIRADNPTDAIEIALADRRAESRGETAPQAAGDRDAEEVAR